LNDPVGLSAAGEHWSLDAEPTVHTITDEPLEVTSGDEPLLLAIPVDALPGPVSYTLDAGDIGGRSTTRVVTWNVLANAPPTGYVAMAGGAPATVKAGYAAAVLVHAEDLEGLAGVTLTATGPVTEASQSQTVAATGNVQDLAFEVEVPADADGVEPVVLEAVITDISDASTTTAAFAVAVTPNEVPAGSLELAAGASATLQPGESTTLAVHAEDPDGLVTITLEADGVVDPASQTLEVTGTSEDVTFTLTVLGEALPGPVPVTAVVTDRFGASFETTALELTVIEDTTLPEAELVLVPDAATFVSGDVVEIIATATDNVGISTLRITAGEDAAESSTSPLSYVWTVPPVAATSPLVITAEATDPAGNPGSATREITVEPLVNAVAPEIRFDCPTSSATLPSGWDLALQATATDDVGVAYVELYRDDQAEPFVILRPAVGTEPTFAASTAVLLPVVTGEQTVRFRAVAWDSSLNNAVAEIEVQVVEAVALDPDEAANDWPALESQFAMLESGTLTLTEPRTLGGLIVLPGASITHPVSAPGAERAVDLTVDGPVYVACGGAIDVTGRGYDAARTYPGESLPARATGGSHLGYGGTSGTAAPGSTYGSVVRPQENGAGGQYNYYGVYGQRGGGVIRLTALDNVTVDGALRADGLTGSHADSRAGAGGSVWIAAAEISGSGTIGARGGDSGTSRQGSGGGGAIALEYGAGSGTLLDHLRAGGGAAEPMGGAGTVYLYGPSSVYGDLIVDNEPANGGVTELPALGGGVAQAASAGAVLVTDRSAIPAYFVGHWVDIRDATSGELEGSWRIAGIDGVTAGVDGVTVTLEANAGETITVDPDDLWQGVYRFDNYAVRNVETVESADPIRLAGTQEITGSVELREIVGHSLILRSGATLSHPPTVSSTAPESLRIELTGDLVIEAGAAIDVSYLGYPASTTYPDETASTKGGGSHLGYGGGGYTGSTYGSVYRPRENGAGGYPSSSALPGGGTVRILAANVNLVDATSAIRANGSPGISPSPRGSAGGSVWITVSGAISGDGTIEAKGGALAEGNNYGSGGGGAIAVDYAAASGTVLDHFRAYGGERDPAGGAGTVYLNGPSSVYGDLIVDNGTAEGGVTELPSLGSGVAQAASAGAVLVTDRGAIPAYFAGHWVEIRDAATGALEGSWRIAAVDGATATLEPNGGETITVDPDDLWQGVYRFDNYAVRGDMTMSSSDPIRVAGTQEMA
ncbi:MAG: hypothetical protein GY856_28470, partial [bacterium]|nr:hypothetical protein [bacterium]